MVTLIHKRKEIRTYELSCAIPVKGCKAEKVQSSKENKKASGMKMKSERVLTLLPNEVRENLPDSVLLSPMIQEAIKRGFIKAKQIVKKSVKSVQENAEEKPSASSKKANK